MRLRLRVVIGVMVVLALACEGDYCDDTVDSASEDDCEDAEGKGGGSSSSGGGGGNGGGGDGGGDCCKYCGDNSQACGDSCISNDKECHTSGGCACEGDPP